MPLPCVQCPAASPIAGASSGTAGVVCRLAQQEGARTDQLLHGENVKPFYQMDGDALIILGFCCGSALPMTDREKGDKFPRAHYTYCPLWLADYDRRQERKKMLMEPEHRPMPKPGVDAVKAGPEQVTDADVAELLELNPEERHAFLR